MAAVGSGRARTPAERQRAVGYGGGGVGGFGVDVAEAGSVDFGAGTRDVSAGAGDEEVY